MSRFSHDPAPGPVLPFAVAALAALYYAWYFMAGYNTADDGHYAQVAYEFWLGTSPRDVRFGYGLLWHHLGAWLFRLTGPDFAMVQGIFFAAMAATAGLAFAVIRQTAGTAAALAGAAVIAVVPAFPPTAFYALCPLLNMWAQLRLARRGAGLTPADAALAGAVLGATFQIRADFGYIFTLSLLAALLCAAWGGRQRAFAAGPAWGPAWGPLLAALPAGFVLVHGPLLAAALAGGWAGLVIDDYLRIPKAVLYVLQLALAGGGATGDGAGTLLARTPLAALWGDGGRRQAAMALLTWGPVAVFAAFALHMLHTLWSLRRRADAAAIRRFAMDGVILTGAAASFPHYFLFRPDLAHIANFMPGFIVLLATFAARLWRAARAAPALAPLPAARLAAGGAAAAAVAYVAVYAGLGLVQPGTGSMLAGRDRDRPFVAENGVRVRLNAGEEATLTALRDLILANSRPNQPIVCVPYCPGVAFMTGRRLLFREHYVDDSFLIGDPGWIDRAIAATRTQRPAVVAIFDWAINGGDISRFDVWAKRYVDSVAALAARRVDFPGGRAYVLAPAGASAGAGP